MQEEIQQKVDSNRFDEKLGILIDRIKGIETCFELMTKQLESL